MNCFAHVQESHNTVYNEVWKKKIATNPSNIFDGYNYQGFLPALERVRNENFIFIAEDTHLKIFLDKAKACDVTRSSEKFLQR